jgi:hypothetical protein
MKANQAAFEVGRLARDMGRGYVTHIAAIRMAPRLDPQALVRLIGDYPSDSVQRKDGTTWSFDTQDALVALADRTIATELPRAWLAGSLLAVGDALERNGYFGRAPQLELIRTCATVLLTETNSIFDIPTGWQSIPPTTAMHPSGTQFSRSHQRSMDSLFYSISWVRAMCSTFCFLSRCT